MVALLAMAQEEANIIPNLTNMPTPLINAFIKNWKPPTKKEKWDNLKIDPKRIKRVRERAKNFLTNLKIYAKSI